MNKTELRIAFACCNHAYTHSDQPGWTDITSLQPDLILLTGDNIYLEDHMWQLWVGKPASWSDDAFARHMHERYAWQWHVPQFRAMLLDARSRQVPVMGVLDDHDFLGNDYYVTPATQTKATIARALLRQFLDKCNTPEDAAYPPLPAQTPEQWQALDEPGFAHGMGFVRRWAQGNTQVLLLDNRSYRTKPSAQGVALGGVQMQWVRAQLSAFQAAGKGRASLVFSGSPLSPGQKCCIPGSPLSDYPAEYQALLEMYGEFRGAGQTIVHIGGDIHYNDWRDRHPQFGHYEVCSSALGSGWLPFSCHANNNFGVIDVAAETLRIRTFGAETKRNIDKLILL